VDSSPPRGALWGTASGPSSVNLFVSGRYVGIGRAPYVIVQRLIRESQTLYGRRHLGFCWNPPCCAAR
jgi:hypothetical protein